MDARAQAFSTTTSAEPARTDVASMNGSIKAEHMAEIVNFISVLSWFQIARPTGSAFSRRDVRGDERLTLRFTGRIERLATHEEGQRHVNRLPAAIDNGADTSSSHWRFNCIRRRCHTLSRACESHVVVAKVDHQIYHDCTFDGGIDAYDRQFGEEDRHQGADHPLLRAD
jgi:hypothetical protein